MTGQHVVVQFPVGVAAAPAGSTQFRSGAATSAGNRRTHNEDAFATDPRWCIVADGMGGHAAGDVASRVAVDTLAARFTSAPQHHPLTVADIRVAITVANDAIRARAGRDGTDGMGTTVVTAVSTLDDAGRPAIAVAHVGDSRCYRLRRGALDLLTHDHSLVNELVAVGRLDPAAAPRHRMANVVTRALGADAQVEADVVLLEPGACRLLLCTDGLSDELSPQAVGRVLAGIDDPELAAQWLVELTLAGAARDNVTAVVIDVIDASNIR